MTSAGAVMIGLTSLGMLTELLMHISLKAYCGTRGSYFGPTETIRPAALAPRAVDQSPGNNRSPSRKKSIMPNLNEMPAIDIAKYLGNRVARRLKRTIGH